MAFLIKATFRFGFYQGHDSYSGQPEDYPSLLRLQQAFMAAGYSLYENIKSENSTSQNIERDLNLPKGIAGALRWFEGNPPDAIDFPKIAGGTAIESKCLSYRRKGCLTQNDGLPKNSPGEPAVSRSHLNGSIVWYWKDAPRENESRTLKQLAREVPYLGETLSAVKLEVSEVDGIPETAHYRNLNQENSFKYKVSCPNKGSVCHLNKFYEHAKKCNDKAINKLKDNGKPTNEKSQHEFGVGPVYNSSSRRFNFAYYGNQTFNQTLNVCPWQQGFLLEAKWDGKNQLWQPHYSEYVAWAKAIHKALVKCITWQYGGNPYLPDSIKNSKNLANGLSIQIISHSLESKLNFKLPTKHDAVLLMLPHGISNDDVLCVKEALQKLRFVYDGKLGKVKVKLSGHIPRLNLAEFWKEPKSGVVRYWKPTPCFVADSKKPKSKFNCDKKWTLEDTIFVSIGYVFKDILEKDELNYIVKANGDAKRFRFAKAIKQANVKVENYRTIPLQANYYTYKQNKNSFFTAADALINLGDFSKTCNTAALAIGQSRHFSGGFLVPVDIKL